MTQHKDDPDDPFPRPSWPPQGVFVRGGQNAGKTIATQRSIAQHLKRHPQAVIMTFCADGTIKVEKPVEVVE